MKYPTDLPNRYEFAELEQGTTHYQIEGPKSGQKLLLIHGATISAWEFDRLVPLLNEAGFQTIRADLLGHGYSQRPDVIYNIELFREQLISLLDHLQIKQPIHIIGHSLGAAIGASLINHNPERFGKLVLTAPLINYVANVPFVRFFKLPLVGMLLARWFAIPRTKRARIKRYGPIEDGRFVTKFHTQFLIPGFDKVFLSLFLNDVLDDQTERYRRLQQSDKELLIVRGVYDEIVTIEQIAHLQALLPCAELIELSEAGHDLIMTVPERVAPVIVKFLTTQPS